MIEMLEKKTVQRNCEKTSHPFRVSYIKPRRPPEETFYCRNPSGREIPKCYYR